MRKIVVGGLISVVLLVGCVNSSRGSVNKIEANTQTFQVVVDYSQSFDDMIVASKYKLNNPYIAEWNFPKEEDRGKTEFYLELLHFNRVMSSDQVLAAMKSRNLRPATLSQFLAFVEKYPEEQRKYPIAALGSIWKDDPCGDWRVPCLWRDSRGWVIELGWFGSVWYGDYRFLAVRES